MIRVAVFGALGRMGREVMSAVDADDELELAAAVDREAAPGGEEMEVGASTVTVFPSIDELDPSTIDVAVDFTVAGAAVLNIEWALANGVHVVVGTTGISAEELEKLGSMAGSSEANALIAPNFTLGAVTMMRLSEIASNVFSECEIVEMHHRGKVDAPSGTAMETARRIEGAMSAPDETDATLREAPGARGAKAGPVRIHSIRLDGFVASQKVIFGSPGETLTISHDTTDRACFMPGVIMAVKAIGDMPGLTIGLEKVLGI
jgi:4-hydroxy-tetrahydrodipicolinate reductase